MNSAAFAAARFLPPESPDPLRLFGPALRLEGNLDR
jgi:hypothetical protein